MPSLVMASELVLKDGRVVDGKIIEQTPKYIKLDIDGGLGKMTYYSDEIDTVDGQKFQTLAPPTPLVDPVAQPIQVVQPAQINPNNEVQSQQESQQVQVSSSDDTLVNETLEKASKYIKQGNYDNAILEFNKAIEINPNKAEIYYVRGSAYAQEKIFDKALVDFQKAKNLGASIDPNDIKSLTYGVMKQGEEYFKQGNYDNAILEFNKAIEASPECADAYYNRGVFYDNQENFSQAISDYSKTIELNPNFAKAYYGRGFEYAKQGNHTQAILDFNKAIEINPNEAVTYYYRGHEYFQRKQYDKALADFQKAKELGADIDPKIINSLKNRPGNWKNTILYFISSLLVFLTIWVSPRKMIWGFFKSFWSK